MMARYMTYAELFALAENQKTKRAEDAKRLQHRAQMHQLMVTPEGRQAAVAILSAQATAEGNNASREGAKTADAVADLAVGTALALEGLPTQGSHPKIVAFVGELARAHRAYAVTLRNNADALREWASAVDQASHKDAERSFYNTLGALKDTRSALEMLRDVTGEEIRTQVRNLTGEDMGPAMTFTPEQMTVLKNNKSNP